MSVFLDGDRQVRAQQLTLQTRGAIRGVGHHHGMNTVDKDFPVCGQNVTGAYLHADATALTPVSIDDDPRHCLAILYA
jgi:hypothetical protein